MKQKKITIRFNPINLLKKNEDGIYLYAKKEDFEHSEPEEITVGISEANKILRSGNYKSKRGIEITFMSFNNFVTINGDYAGYENRYTAGQGIDLEETDFVKINCTYSK